MTNFSFLLNISKYFSIPAIVQEKQSKFSSIKKWSRTIPVELHHANRRIKYSKNTILIYYDEIPTPNLLSTVKLFFCHMRDKEIAQRLTYLNYAIRVADPIKRRYSDIINIFYTSFCELS